MSSHKWGSLLGTDLQCRWGQNHQLQACLDRIENSDETEWKCLRVNKTEAQKGLFKVIRKNEVSCSSCFFSLPPSPLFLFEVKPNYLVHADLNSQQSYCLKFPSNTEPASEGIWSITTCKQSWPQSPAPAVSWLQSTWVCAGTIILMSDQEQHH